MKFDNLTDELLMEEIARGSSEASSILLDRYKNQLFAFLYRLILNQTDAEDIFQETWIRIIKYAHTFNASKKFSTWLFQIAVNCSRDFINCKHYEANIEEEITVCDVNQIEDFENKEFAESIIEKLPLSFREVVILRYFHDKKEKEIAELLSIPIGTVKSRLHKAIAFLKKFYDEKGGQNE